MKTTNKTVALALSGAFVLSLGMSSVNAAENPFSATVLSEGYQVADAHEAKDGKCGAGKCGTEMKKSADGKSDSNKKESEKSTDGKCGTGKCGH